MIDIKRGPSGGGTRRADERKKSVSISCFDDLVHRQARTVGARRPTALDGNRGSATKSRVDTENGIVIKHHGFHFKRRAGRFASAGRGHRRTVADRSARFRRVRPASFKRSLELYFSSIINTDMLEIYGGGTIKRDRRLRFCVRRRRSLTHTKLHCACANDLKIEHGHTNTRVFITRNRLSVTFIIGTRPVTAGYRRRPIGSVNAQRANRHTVRRATLISERGMCTARRDAYSRENGSFRRATNNSPKDTRPWTCVGAYLSFYLYDRYHY